MSVISENIVLKRIQAKKNGAVGEAALAVANSNGAQPRINEIDFIEDGDVFTPTMEGFFADPLGTGIVYGFVVDTTNTDAEGNVKTAVKQWYIGNISKSFRLVDPITQQPTDEWARSGGDVYNEFVNHPTMEAAVRAIVGRPIQVKLEKKLGLKRNFRTDKDEVKTQTVFTHNFVTQ